MANLNLVTGYWGKEHVTSADQGSYNAAMMGSGEFILERGNQFAANIISNNKVRVLDGDLMMQGRHIRLLEDTYIELLFDNGTQGYKRNDLIVVRYTKDSTTGIENCNLVVIKGTPAESNPADPTYTVGNIIQGHALLNEMPLYRVVFDGLNIQPLVKLFNVVPTWETLKNETITDIYNKTDEIITDFKGNVVDDLQDVLAVTEPNVPVGCNAISQLNSNLPITLWENPNPSLPFSPQSIMLDSADYNYLEIYSYNSKTCFCTKILKGYNASIQDTDSLNNQPRLTSRPVLFVTDTQYNFSNCFIVNVGGSYSVNNDRLVPIKILGFK